MPGSTLYNSYSGHVNSIFIGSKISHIMYLIHKYGSTLVFACIIILLGLILLIISAVMKSHKSNIDVLTGLKNRNSFEEKLSELNENLEITNSVCMIVLDLNNLKNVPERQRKKRLIKNRLK